MTTQSGSLRFALIAALGYAVMLVAVVGSLSSARGWALANLATDESIAEWRTWRDDVRRQQTEPGPVARRVPKSSEPPGLVLMRDYFAVCMTGAVLFTSLLYWVLAWFLHGILTSNSTHQPEAPAREPMC